MARVLIGWELGAGSGHTVRLLDTAAELRRRGHHPIIVAQNIAAIPPGHELWQAPLWPSLLSSRGRTRRLPPATFGDILVELGISDPGALAGLLRAWESILAAVRPDVVIAEFSPALLMAAQGRVPALLFGSGFGTPPAGMSSFPSLTGKAAMHDERGTLAIVNRALAETGRAPLSALPAIFTADRTLAQTFSELDPYRRWRGAGDVAAPHVSGLAPVVDGGGEELFVYVNGAQSALDALVGGLVDTGLPVRLHNPRLSEAEVATLEQFGIACERKPLPLARIAERSRLVVSHGGLGFSSAALCAGLPHVTLPFDIEKQLTGAALEIMGLGRSMAFRDLDRSAFATLLRDMFADDAMVRRAIAAAPGFRARTGRSSEQMVVDGVEALLRA